MCKDRRHKTYCKYHFFLGSCNIFVHGPSWIHKKELSLKTILHIHNNVHQTLMFYLPMFIISWVWRNLKYWVCVFGSSHNKRQLSRIRKYACQQMSSNLRLFWFIDKHFFASKLVIHTFYQQNVGRQTVQTKILGVKCIFLQEWKYFVWMQAWVRKR